MIFYVALILTFQFDITVSSPLMTKLKNAGAPVAATGVILLLQFQCNYSVISLNYSFSTAASAPTIKDCCINNGHDYDAGNKDDDDDHDGDGDDETIRHTQPVFMFSYVLFYYTSLPAL